MMHYVCRDIFTGNPAELKSITLSTQLVLDELNSLATSPKINEYQFTDRCFHYVFTDELPMNLKLIFTSHGMSDDYCRVVFLP